MGPCPVGNGGRYKVTYRLHRKGNLKVGMSDGSLMGVYRDGERKHRGPKLVGRVLVCFLPKEWEGMNVIRTVEVLS